MSESSFNPFDGTTDFAIWKVKMRALFTRERGALLFEEWLAGTSLERKKELQDQAHAEIMMKLSDDIIRQVKMSGVGEPVHNITIHYNKNRYTVKDITSVRFKHQDMMNHIWEQALKDLPTDTDLYLTVTVPVPGTAQSVRLENLSLENDDDDVKRMFDLYNRIQTIHVVLKVSTTPLTVTPPPQDEEDCAARMSMRARRSDGDLESYLKIIEDELDQENADYVMVKRHLKIIEVKCHLKIIEDTFDKDDADYLEVVMRRMDELRRKLAKSMRQQHQAMPVLIFLPQPAELPQEEPPSDDDESKAWAWA